MRLNRKDRSQLQPGDVFFKAGRWWLILEIDRGEIRAVTMELHHLPGGNVMQITHGVQHPPPPYDWERDGE